MASIVKRNNSYCVVYTYKHTNGTLKQKWETFTDLADAKNRKKEVEYKESVGTEEPNGHFQPINQTLH